VLDALEKQETEKYFKEVELSNQLHKLEVKHKSETEKLRQKHKSDIHKLLYFQLLNQQKIERQQQQQLLEIDQKKILKKFKATKIKQKSDFRQM